MPALNFEQIYDRAKLAAQAELDRFSQSVKFGGTVGSAVVVLPARGNFAKFLQEKGYASKVSPGLWLSLPVRVDSQNIDVYEAVARVVAQSLTESGIKGVHVHSWVD